MPKAIVYLLMGGYRAWDLGFCWLAIQHLGVRRFGLRVWDLGFRFGSWALGHRHTQERYEIASYIRFK